MIRGFIQPAPGIQFLNITVSIKFEEKLGTHRMKIAGRNRIFELGAFNEKSIEIYYHLEVRIQRF